MAAPKDALTYRLDRDIEVAFPVYSFLITPDHPRDETVILMDTGVKPADDPYMQKRGHTVGPPGGGPQPLVDGLAAHDLEPIDVDYVVLSHLHHDHAANNHLFSEAKFLIQRAELEAARDPLPVFQISFPSEIIDPLNDLHLTIVEGDYVLRDGIELLLTPGHTHGQQSILVETEDGPYVLVGDLAYLQHNLQPELSSMTDAEGKTHEITSSNGDYWPPGIHVDVDACYESIERVKGRIGEDGTLVPSHEIGLGQ